ncbi:MAG: lamin tail domain-containing protein [Proteobacteria bacterium]|nr:lamin tail domain-containing protein [Pseudomonadota bacterium]
MKVSLPLLLILAGCTTGGGSGSLTQLPSVDDDDDDDDAASNDDDAASDDDDDAGVDARVVVNELMADNQGSIYDNEGLPSDWVELYNMTGDSIDLGGWSISDDWTDPTRHVLADSLVLPSHGRLLLWASATPEAGDRHLGFRLSSQGESVGAFDPDGASVDWITYPPQDPGMARAREPDGGDDWIEVPGGTPGAPN